MQELELGKTIVHPTHGTGKVKEIKEVCVMGEPTTYYVLDFGASDVGKVMIPLDKVQAIGLRNPVTPEVLQETIDYLESPEVEVQSKRSNFHRIHKEYTERIAKGCIFEIAKVYKALSKKGLEKELGLKDKLLFEKTETMLVGEIGASYQITIQESKTKLTSALNIN
ncbi:MAG: hypothetical protein COB02_05680 [Candidatus Cloacimonadota bacterium]|nr:MAG: hypothetical protein COB02_05680 [Candidatus Cloacimonadota bacterium]